jgi:hypothetical protein
MKIIFTALIITCLAFGASAQVVTPNLLQNHLNYFRVNTLKIDTGYNKLTQTPNATYNLFNQPMAAALTVDYAGFTAEVVYSHMPVKHLRVNDRMPIATIDVAGCDISVKRITVTDPLVKP